MRHNSVCLRGVSVYYFARLMFRSRDSSPALRVQNDIARYTLRIPFYPGSWDDSWMVRFILKRNPLAFVLSVESAFYLIFVVNKKNPSPADTGEGLYAKYMSKCIIQPSSYTFRNVPSRSRRIHPSNLLPSPGMSLSASCNAFRLSGTLQPVSSALWNPA